MNSVDKYRTTDYYIDSHELILAASWEIFKKIEQQSVYPIIFRHELSKLIKEDEEKTLAFFELKLIEDSWILQKRAGALIKPSEKLLKKFEVGKG